MNKKNIIKKTLSIITLFWLLSVNLGTSVYAVDTNISKTSLDNKKVENIIFSIQKKYFKSLNEKALKFDEEYIQPATDFIIKSNLNDNSDIWLNYNAYWYLKWFVKKQPENLNFKFNFSTKNNVNLNFNKGIYEKTNIKYDLADNHSKLVGDVTYNWLFTKEKIDWNNSFIKITDAKFDDKLIYNDDYYKLYNLDKVQFEKTKQAINRFEEDIKFALNKYLANYNSDIDNFFKEFNANTIKNIINENYDKKLLKETLTKLRNTQKEIYDFSQKEPIFQIYKHEWNKYYFTINPKFISLVKKIDKDYKLGLDREDTIEKIYKEWKITDTMLKYMEMKGYNVIKLQDDNSLTFLQLEKVNTQINAFYVNFNKDKIKTFLFAIKKWKQNDLFLTYIKDDKFNIIIKEYSTYSIKNAYINKCKNNVEKIPSMLIGSLDLNNQKIKFNYNMADRPFCEKGKINYKAIKFSWNGQLTKFLTGKAEEVVNKKITKKIGQLTVINTKDKLGYKLNLTRYNPTHDKECSVSLDNAFSILKWKQQFSTTFDLNVNKCENMDFKLTWKYAIKYNFKDNSKILNNKINEIKKIWKENMINPSELFKNIK